MEPKPQLTAGQKKGIIGLCLVIVALVGYRTWVHFTQPDISLFSFETVSEEKPDSNDVGLGENESKPIPSFPVELNSSDSLTLLTLPGIGPVFAGRIIKYRNAKGGFHQKEELKEVYGLPPETWAKIADKVYADTLGAAFSQLQQARNHRYASAYGTKDKFSSKSNETSSGNLNEKPTGKFTPEGKEGRTYKPRPPVELNTADSAALVEVFGIGPKLAPRILKFRQKLGFFHSVVQLREVWGMGEENFERIKTGVKIENPLEAFPHLEINKMDVAELAQHPYLSWGEASAIVAYRKEHGAYRNLADLSPLYGLKPETIGKISPYLRF